MKCQDFERVLNEQLDARDAVSADVEQSLEVHASTCPSCRAIAARYQSLRLALRCLPPGPVASPDLIERVLNAHERDSRHFLKISRFWSVGVPVAAAAALALAAFVARMPSRTQEPGAPAIAAKTQAAPTASESLTDALALAGSATWDLARETSAPAARVGREVLDATVLADNETALPIPMTLTAAPSKVLQDVSDRVNAGVRPLSGTARHAFGFLLGTLPDDSDAHPAKAKGA